MNGYKHKQIGTALLVVLAALCFLEAILGFTVARATLLAIPVLLIFALLFSSLTIEITSDELRWWFGPGMIRKQVPLSEITSVAKIRTRWIDGLGIHWSGHGWLYNVSGYDAVAVTLRTGKKFTLGTDEPDALIAALQIASEKR